MSDDKPDYASEFGRCYVTGDALGAYNIINAHPELDTGMDDIVLLRLINDLCRQDRHEQAHRLENILIDRKGPEARRLLPWMELLLDCNRDSQLRSNEEE